METQSHQTTATVVRPLHIDMPEEALADLRRRIAATRLPHKETVADRSQGVQLATMQALAGYWVTEYDWRAGGGGFGLGAQPCTHRVRGPQF